MRIAVLTLTRDRLAYTRHCFAKLREYAGCDFDHYVLDQGSTDGTAEWLRDEYDPDFLCVSPRNLGISPGMNKLLDWTQETADYDVVVKFDNDCKLMTPNTLRDICELVDEYGLFLSPRIRGLNHPPATIGTPLSLGGTLVDEKAQIGGIFLAAPAETYIWRGTPCERGYGFSYDENNPTWGGDDVEICAWWRARGGRCGYVHGYDAWHYETTEGQRERYPDYFARKDAEFAA